MDNFSKDIAHKLQYSNYKKTSFSKLKNFPLIKGKQCIYVLDWKQSKLTFSNGLVEMLGYLPKEFTYELIIESVHPEDKLIVNRILKGLMSLALQTNISLSNTYLNLSYRMRKKDGNYIKLLRHSSPFQTDNKGVLVSNWTLLSDISFMNQNNKVEWEVLSDDLDVFNI